MHGEQVLRPLGNYTPEVDLVPFRNYAEHPPFVEAIHRIVGHFQRHELPGMFANLEFDVSEQCTTKPAVHVRPG